MNGIEIVGSIAAIGTFLAILQSIHGLREQLRLSIFTDYTKRYQDILLSLPADVSSSQFDFKSLDTEERELFLRYMRAYFDLCSEEYFLHLKGKIDKAVWEEWKSGIETAFRKPAFEQAWAHMKFQREDHAEFAKYIESIT